jgi:hypothetical protein
MGKGSDNGPPRLAGKRFTFWAHRIASYRQVQHHDAWRTTMYPLPTVPIRASGAGCDCPPRGRMRRNFFRVHAAARVTPQTHVGTAAARVTPQAVSCPWCRG